MKQALITGGLGFIGCHLAERLFSDGVDIIVVDNLQSNAIKPEEVSRKYRVIKKSIKDVNFYRMHFDILFHLASPVGPVGVLNYSGQMAQMMIDDTNKVRDVCIDKNVPFIFVSSSEIYGHHQELDEDSQKVFPGKYSVRSEYGAAKMLAEISLVNMARVNPNLKYQIIRPFNVAGPKQLPDNGFVLPRFINQALTNCDLTVYGDGTQRRAFTDVRDIVDAIIHLANYKEINSIWNVGNPANEMSIGELAVRVLDIFKKIGIETESKITNVDPKMLHGDLFEEVPDKIPYVKKLDTTGWKPKFSFEKTVMDAILSVCTKGEA